jgi:hypothetical protein
MIQVLTQSEVRDFDTFWQVREAMQEAGLLAPPLFTFLGPVGELEA